jgi:hypothetical protein
MKLSQYVVLTAALWSGVTIASAVLRRDPAAEPNESGLHFELGMAPLDETIEHFLKRSSADANAAGISGRDSNPNLHDKLLASSPLETVESFVKRTCPGGSGATCCPPGKFKVRPYKGTFKKLEHTDRFESLVL